MSRWRRAARAAAVALIALASLAAGVYASAMLAPQRLRREVERQVERATGAPCRIGSLRVEPGLPFEVEGRELVLRDGMLRVERVTARVSLAAALVGRVRLSQLELEGAVLRIDERPDAPALPWLAAVGPTGPETGGPDRWVHALQDAVRAVLEGPSLADTLRLRGGRVEVREGEALVFAFEDIRAELVFHRLRGDSALVAQTRIHAGDAHRGLLEGRASSSPDRALRVTLAASELDLGWLTDRLGRSSRGAPRSRGRLSGVADLHAPTPEASALDLDLVARDVAVAAAGARKPWFSAPEVRGQLRVEADPMRLVLGESHFESGPLRVELGAALARPLRADAPLGLRARVADAAVAELREMVEDMRAGWVEDARPVLEALESGRVVSLEARGTASWRAWGAWLSNGADALLDGLEVRARVADLRVRLDADDALENLSGRISWLGDRIELRGVRGERGGALLPRLDLELEGVSHLLASDLGVRVPDSDRVLLAGLPRLLEQLEPEEDSSTQAPHFEVELERLEHPALFWPMRGVELSVDHRDGALVGEIRRATWAGVPLHGALEWRDDPMHLVARLIASRPRKARGRAAPSAPVPEPAVPEGAWASGRVEVGPLRSKIWAHERLGGRVWAIESTLYAADVQGVLAPRGTIAGSGQIDLGVVDALPYRARFDARGLDAGTLVGQAGLGEGLVSGRVDLVGDLRGRYRPGSPPFAELSGMLDVDARNGVVRHDLPAALALTLASQRLDFTPNRENVRYTRCTASLALTDGVIRTDALELDGPDVRLFGSGTLDLGHPPHALDAEVVVFLLRPVDWALGGIPILGDILLGGADNLLAAYFRLNGPWDAPTATAQPLRTFNTGPMRFVTGLPGVVIRGLEALGGAMRPEEPPPPGNAGGP